MAWGKKKESEYQTYDEPQGDQILEVDDKNVVVVEESEFNGTDYFNIRKWFQNRDGKWGRGKGISVPLEMKDDLLEALYNYMQDGPKKKKKPAKESSRRREEPEEDDDKPARKTSSKNNKNTPSSRTSRLNVGKKPANKTSRASRLSNF